MHLATVLYKQYCRNFVYMFTCQGIEAGIQNVNTVIGGDRDCCGEMVVFWL